MPASSLFRSSWIGIVVTCFLNISPGLRADPPAAYILVLGIAQDGGYPHAGCRRACCQRAWTDASQAAWVTCLAIVDPQSNQRWLIECTPDFKYQFHALQTDSSSEEQTALAGVFLTHAHIGHYTGLMNFGREVMGSREIPVFVMPRLAQFLRTSGPWSQLVDLENIELHLLAADTPTALNDRLSITPIEVPHRDEFSETVGFCIEGPRRSALFLPDIDKWDQWNRSIEEVLDQVDVAYLDGTFFDGNELPGRNLEEIPHPFVVETIERFKELPPRQRAKVRFLHLNHTNPLLDPQSAASREVDEAGMHVARQLEQFEL